MRDENFNSGDEEGKEAERDNPVRDADYGKVPGRTCHGWQGSGKTRDPRGIRHAQILSGNIGRLEIEKFTYDLV